MLQGAVEGQHPALPARVHGRLVARLPGGRPAAEEVSRRSRIYVGTGGGKRRVCRAKVRLTFFSHVKSLTDLASACRW